MKKDANAKLIDFEPDIVLVDEVTKTNESECQTPCKGKPTKCDVLIGEFH